MEALAQQVDATLAGIAAFFARYGWSLLLTAVVAWWAWTIAEPRLREAANQRAIRWVWVPWVCAWLSVLT